MEVWKPVPNYEDLYEVSNTGKIRSLCGRYGHLNELKQCIGSKGYLLVTLCRKGKQKTTNVHRIVATVFIPNPNGYPCINHKDLNKQNNMVNNLEWCSYTHNNTFAERAKRSGEKRGLPVKCVETGAVFYCAYEASRKTGIRQSGISMCCNGKLKTSGGFHWTFV